MSRVPIFILQCIDKVRVEYTFGYKRNDDGKVRIYLHHSSVPFGK